MPFSWSLVSFLVSASISCGHCLLTPEGTVYSHSDSEVSGARHDVRNFTHSNSQQLQKSHHQQIITEATKELWERSFADGQSLLVGFTSDTPGHNLIINILHNIFEADLGDLKAFVVSVHSEDGRELMQRFGLDNTPSIVYAGQNREQEQVFGGYDLNTDNIRLYLMALTVQAQLTTMTDFDTQVLDTDSGDIPMMVCFYAPWADSALTHLTHFRETVNELLKLKVRLRFGVVDVSRDKIAVARWVQAKFAVRVPFTLLFHTSLKRTGVVEVHQSPIALAPELPSFWRVYSRLQELSLNLTSHLTSREHNFPNWGEPYTNQVSLRSEGPLGSQCLQTGHNLTDCDHRPVSIYNISSLRTNSKPHSQKRKSLVSGLKKFSGIPMLTEERWADAIERSHVEHNYLNVQQWQTTTVSLVIYIMQGCGSCERNIPVFQQLSRAVSFTNRGMVYVVNCTSEQGLCAQEGVTGFPTLVAYRGLDWMGGGGCTSVGGGMDRHVRMDYHGVILVDPIMTWFQDVTTNAVNNYMFDVPPYPMTEDVRLVAVLMLKFSRYLPIPPARDYNYYLPRTCFQLICERLYGQAKCYTIYSQDIPHSDFTPAPKQLIVAKIIFYRRDGVEVPLTHLGRPLLASLSAEMDSNLHRFHTPHPYRYNLPSNLRCEDDHGLCCDVVVNYTRDHSHLAVTQMTSILFHTRHSLFLAGKPVLLALVHPENTTEDSPFLQTLRAVGYELYNEVTVVTVDVVEFPSWAGQFVPLGYHSMDIDDKSQMYAYPRLCLVFWNNHRQAAFYPAHRPPSTTEFQTQQIVDFVKEFVENPAKFLVETEHF